MQPLPFSEAELLNLFILLVHVSVFVSLAVWFNVYESYSISDSLSSRFVFANKMFCVLSLRIAYGTGIYCCWSVNEHIYFYRSKQAIKRRTFVFPFGFLHMCLVPACFALPFISLFWFRCTYYDEMIVSSVCSCWWNELTHTHSYTYVYSQWFNPCEPIRATAQWWRDSVQNEWAQHVNKTFSTCVRMHCLYIIGIDRRTLWKPVRHIIFACTRVFITIPFHSILFDIIPSFSRNLFSWSIGAFLSNRIFSFPSALHFSSLFIIFIYLFSCYLLWELKNCSAYQIGVVCVRSSFFILILYHSFSSHSVESVGYCFRFPFICSIMAIYAYTGQSNELIVDV